MVLARLQGKIATDVDIALAGAHRAAGDLHIALGPDHQFARRQRAAHIAGTRGLLHGDGLRQGSQGFAQAVGHLEREMRAHFLGRPQLDCAGLHVERVLGVQDRTLGLDFRGGQLDGLAVDLRRPVARHQAALLVIAHADNDVQFAGGFEIDVLALHDAACQEDILALHLGLAIAGYPAGDAARVGQVHLALAGADIHIAAHECGVVDRDILSAGIHADRAGGCHDGTTFLAHRIGRLLARAGQIDARHQYLGAIDGDPGVPDDVFLQFGDLLCRERLSDFQAQTRSGVGATVHHGLDRGGAAAAHPAFRAAQLPGAFAQDHLRVEVVVAADKRTVLRHIAQPLEEVVRAVKLLLIDEFQARLEERPGQRPGVRRRDILALLARCHPAEHEAVAQQIFQDRIFERQIDVLLRMSQDKSAVQRTGQGRDRTLAYLGRLTPRGVRGSLRRALGGVAAHDHAATRVLDALHASHHRLRHGIEIQLASTAPCLEFLPAAGHLMGRQATPVRAQCRAQDFLQHGGLAHIGCRQYRRQCGRGVITVSNEKTVPTIGVREDIVQHLIKGIEPPPMAMGDRALVLDPGLIPAFLPVHLQEIQDIQLTGQRAVLDAAIDMQRPARQNRAFVIDAGVPAFLLMLIQVDIPAGSHHALLDLEIRDGAADFKIMDDGLDPTPRLPVAQAMRTGDALFRLVADTNLAAQFGNIFNPRRVDDQLAAGLDPAHLVAHLGRGLQRDIAILGQDPGIRPIEDVAAAHADIAARPHQRSGMIGDIPRRDHIEVAQRGDLGVVIDIARAGLHDDVTWILHPFAAHRDGARIEGERAVGGGRLAPGIYRQARRVRNDQGQVVTGAECPGIGVVVGRGVQIMAGFDGAGVVQRLCGQRGVIDMDTAAGAVIQGAGVGRQLPDLDLPGIGQRLRHRQLGLGGRHHAGGLVVDAFRAQVQRLGPQQTFVDKIAARLRLQRVQAAQHRFLPQVADVPLGGQAHCPGLDLALVFDPAVRLDAERAADTVHARAVQVAGRNIKIPGPEFGAGAKAGVTGDRQFHEVAGLDLAIDVHAAGAHLQAVPLPVVSHGDEFVRRAIDAVDIERCPSLAHRDLTLAVEAVGADFEPMAVEAAGGRIADRRPGGVRRQARDRDLVRGRDEAAVVQLGADPDIQLVIAIRPAGATPASQVRYLRQIIQLASRGDADPSVGGQLEFVLDVLR